LLTAAILQFAKTPQSGSVKTRLLPALSGQQAMALHKNLVRHTAAQIVKLKHCQHYIFSTAGGEFIESLCEQYMAVHCLQQGADLGERIAMGCREIWQKGRPTIIVGSDCPDLSTDYYHQAIEALQRKSLVIGPAHDGGYVLIGMRELYPQLFEGICWSTSRVLQQTLMRAEEQGLSVEVLDTLSDIDRPDDLARLRSDPLLSYLLDKI